MTIGTVEHFLPYDTLDGAIKDVSLSCWFCVSEYNSFGRFPFLRMFLWSDLFLKVRRLVYFNPLASTYQAWETACFTTGVSYSWTVGTNAGTHFSQACNLCVKYEYCFTNEFYIFLYFYQVTNIDGVLKRHNDFLDRCLKDCMLTNPELLKVNTPHASHFPLTSGHKQIATTVTDMRGNKVYPI